MSEDITIKAGTIVLIEDGTYSDRFTWGVVRVLQDISSEAWECLRKEFMKGTTGHGYWAKATVDGNKFLAEITRRGWVEDVEEFRTIHVDDMQIYN